MSAAQTSMIPPVSSIPFSCSAPMTPEECSPASEKLWLRLVGLPFSATESDILGFASGFGVASGPQSVVFSPTRSGRGCDRVFVRMVSAAEAFRAEAALHGQYMKNRFIEVRRVAMRHVLRELKNAQTPPQEAHQQQPQQHQPMQIPKVMSEPTFAPNPFQQTLPLPIAHCITLVGLPYNCSTQDIFAFLGGHHVRAFHVCGNRGDKCVLELNDAKEVARAVKRRHRQYLGGRYIEVYASRPCDMRCNCPPVSVLVAAPHGGFVPLPLLDMMLAGCMPPCPVPPMGWMPSVDPRSMSPTGSEEPTPLNHGMPSTTTLTSVPSFSSLCSSATGFSVHRANSAETSSSDEFDTTASECKSETKDEEVEYKTGPVFVHDPYNLPAVTIVEEEVIVIEKQESNDDTNSDAEFTSTTADSEEQNTIAIPESLSVGPPKQSTAEEWAAMDEEDDFSYNQSVGNAASATNEESGSESWDMRGGAASPSNSSSTPPPTDSLESADNWGNAVGGSAARLPTHYKASKPQQPSQPHPMGMPGMVPPFGAFGFVPPHPMMMSMAPTMPIWPGMPWPGMSMPVSNVHGNNGMHGSQHNNEQSAAACTCQNHGKGFNPHMATPAMPQRNEGPAAVSPCRA